MRLNKFLSSSGICSRRKADEMIKNGLVEVNNKVVNELGSIVNEKKDIVKVEGKVVSLPHCRVYLKLFKPKGYVCSAHDERGRKTIYELVKSERRLFSAKKISHPTTGIEKEYHVSVVGAMKESEFAVLRKGVVFDGNRMPSARVKPISFDGKITKVSIIIDEGQNRQVRRMFEAIGREIKLLKRVRIGSVKLGGLKRGEARDLREDEVQSLMELV